VRARRARRACGGGSSRRAASGTPPSAQPRGDGAQGVTAPRRPPALPPGGQRDAGRDVRVLVCEGAGEVGGISRSRADRGSSGGIGGVGSGHGRREASRESRAVNARARQGRPQGAAERPGLTDPAAGRTLTGRARDPPLPIGARPRLDAGREHRRSPASGRVASALAPPVGGAGSERPRLDRDDPPLPRFRLLRRAAPVPTGSPTSTPGPRRALGDRRISGAHERASPTPAWLAR
jgi:hypothetical protein